MKEPDHVCIPLEIAAMLNRVFLPHNPNKMRKAHPEVIAAVKQFQETLKQAIAEARNPTTPSPRAER